MSPFPESWRRQSRVPYCILLWLCLSKKLELNSEPMNCPPVALSSKRSSLMALLGSDGRGSSSSSANGLRKLLQDRAEHRRRTVKTVTGRSLSLSPNCHFTARIYSSQERRRKGRSGCRRLRNKSSLEATEQTVKVRKCIWHWGALWGTCVASTFTQSLLCSLLLTSSALLLPSKEHCRQTPGTCWQWPRPDLFSPVLYLPGHCA